jgi:hypothetical protein
MMNIQGIIANHNKRILAKSQKATQNKQCNCRVPAECPLSGKCLTESIIYQANVETNDGKPAETYVGLTANSFKTRYSNHKSTFNHANKKFSTELSSHIWSLKEKGINYKVSWKILKQANPYNKATDRCNLCIW